MSQLADIIAQETRDGRLIVRFLIYAMDGEFPDFQPCHRIDAARLLVKLGFDRAQAAVDRANAARRARQREPRAQAEVQQQSEAQAAAKDVRAELARIVREETAEGRSMVMFLVDVMEGDRPGFKPCHRLSAAKELLQRGFDYVPEEAEAQAEPEPEPEPTPEEAEAQRRLSEDREFALHGPPYYESYAYPCVCEDRLHDCEGNVLTEEERAQIVREGPGKQFFISEPDRIADYYARYGKYLERWNVEHPEARVDINRIHWVNRNWKHLNPVGSINPVEELKRIRGP
ncbi:MAG: hypothetical protein F4W95_05295 [Chloroflexi bacterium]|nr:hypothetical protein [Chloroflexota bacterium]